MKPWVMRGRNSPRGAALHMERRHYKDRLLQQYGVDRLVLGTASSIYRVRDDRAATEIFPTWIKAFADLNSAEEIDAKTGVPNARCFERKDAAVAEVPQLRFTVSSPTATSWRGLQRRQRRRPRTCGSAVRPVGQHELAQLQR